MDDVEKREEIRRLPVAHVASRCELLFAGPSDRLAERRTSERIRASPVRSVPWTDAHGS